MTPTPRPFIAGAVCQQDDASQKICEDKSSGEMFRLKAGKANCRDVVQCTASVSAHNMLTDTTLLSIYFDISVILFYLCQGLQQIRCPPGLAFDLEKQTCDWKAAVNNCDQLTRERKVNHLILVRPTGSLFVERTFTKIFAINRCLNTFPSLISR